MDPNPNAPTVAPVKLRTRGELGLESYAADLEATSTGELVFLEIMFARFDQECSGRLSDALVAHLCGRGV